MDNAKQHWKILQKLGSDLANRVREFLVVGHYGNGVIVATEDGLAFWLGEIWYCKKTVTKPTPLNVPDLVQMAQGHNHILLLNKQGEIYSMGDNLFGQLGLGNKNGIIHFSPKLISIPYKITSVRCGFAHNLALTEDGKVWAWGANYFSQVGVPSSTDFLSSPRQISELDPHRVVAVECGSSHSLALTDQGDVYAWGSNDWGQLGDEIRLSKHIPTQIPTPSPVQSMTTGAHHTLLLTQTGEVWACGRNKSGQLGFSTTTEFNPRLSKVLGLPPISQIASHFITSLSIAMSSDQRCFVWGELDNVMPNSSPIQLPTENSTLDSPLSSFAPGTPHSVSISETPPSPLSARMSRMFDNPETSSDVQFVVEQRTIHAHRDILSNSSGYFARMFSKRWPDPVDPENPIVRVTIPDHSYQVLHAFLRFLYTDSLVVHFDLLPELLELAIQYRESNLLQACLTRMRTTLTFSTCCLYYQFTLRHSLPELDSFQQELFQFALANFVEVINSAGYQSMDAELCKKLTFSMATQLGKCVWFNHGWKTMVEIHVFTT